MGVARARAGRDTHAFSCFFLLFPNRFMSASMTLGGTRYCSSRMLSSSSCAASPLERPRLASKGSSTNLTSPAS